MIIVTTVNCVMGLCFGWPKWEFLMQVDIAFCVMVDV